MVDRATARGSDFLRLDQVESFANLHGIKTRCSDQKRLELGFGHHNPAHNLYDLAHLNRIDGE